jgi:hypothetical protein
MSEHQLRRDPPDGVKQALREEVGFGCPVPGCREPFLTWHHFDPPWHVRKHHEPSGMIALCVKHHAMADRGVFTNGQLRQFKAAANSVEDVRAKFEWARPKQLVRLGGYYMGGRNPGLRLDVGGGEEVVVALTEGAHGLLELSFALRDDRGALVAAMTENVFTAYPERIYDLEVDAGATSIRIRAAKRHVLLGLRCERVSPDGLRRRLEEDWERAQVAIAKTAAAHRGVGPVWRDSQMGALDPTGEPGQAVPRQWRDPRTGRVLDSRERIIGLIHGWATAYCLDDQGNIPLIDFRDLLTYLDGLPLHIRDGVSTGPRAFSFGYYFSRDMPPPGDEHKEPPEFPFPGR